jgi:Flp pilus assembly protein TadD
VANSVAWFCLLSPESGIEFAKLVPLAEWAVAKWSAESPATRRSSLQGLGMALYRAGRFAQAIERLHEAIQAQAKGGDAWAHFFLAMAHQQLGQKDEARQWYDKGVEWVEKNQHILEKNKPNQNELRRFRAEAAQLLGLDKRETPPEK